MKILVTHASAGAGHLKAAESVYLGIKKYTQHEAVFVDTLDHTSATNKKLYSGTYSFMISKIPFVWGGIFALLDVSALQLLVRFFRRVYNSLHAAHFHSFLIKEQFDCIISTHFLPTEVAASLKRRGKISSRLITCVTDFDVHRIWLAEGVDVYAVACPYTKDKMLSLGVPAEKIKVTGIPTNERFSHQPDISELKKKIGLIEDAFTVLVATGSFGIGPIEEIIESLKDFQVVVVCGHNKKLYAELSTKNLSYVKVLGLVDNMHELMAVSDVMVTKPGGLSISEALVSQLPMIFFNAIPGQETNNVKVLKTFSIGLSGLSIAQIAGELNKYKSSKDAFLTAVKKTKDLARPDAVKDIIALL